MHKTLLKAVGLLAFLTCLNIASAANLGGINVTSALGHPLRAEISLAELGKSDKSTLVAKLASVNEFKSAGMDYPYSLPKLTFQIDTRPNGELYVKISSTQPVNDPFVSLLIELSWSSGKLLREYTFLLDPAGFVAEQPKMAEVKPVEPVVSVQEPMPVVVPVPAMTPEAEAVPAMSDMAKAELAAAEQAKEPAPEMSDMAKAELAAAEQAKEPAPEMSDMAKAELAAAESAKAESVMAEPGKVEPAESVKVEPLAPTPQAAEAAASVLVEKGDTLSKIADAVKPVDVSLERMLVAMYRANAKTFDGKNMNRIRAGKILRMPESFEIEKVSQAAAVKEIRAQVADWQDYRQKLAAAHSEVSEQVHKQEAAGKISAAVAEKAPVIKDSAKEVLKLSKGESLGDKAVAGGAAKSKQEKMADKADDAAAKNKQLLEDKKKIAKLEVLNKDVSKLVELKGGTTSNVAEVKPESAPAAASAPAAPVVKKMQAASAVPAVIPATEEPGILDSITTSLMEDPIVLGVVVAVLLGLGGLGFVIVRRRGKAGQKKSSKKPEVSSKKVEDIGSATGSWRTPVTPSPDTGDFTQTLVSSSAAAPMSVAAALDDVDPISEADLFLNFGRDAQAEEILKDALSKNSSNNQVKLKLLSIYVNRKDSNTFSRYANEIKDSGDAAAWERAAVMGRELDPDNPSYGGVKGEIRSREPAKAEVDFDLGMGTPSAPAASKPADDFKMDFDVTGIQSSMDEKPIDLNAPFEKPAGVSHAKPSANVDATSILSRADVNAAQAASPMDFDVSGILPGEAKNIAQSGAMDFDVSGALPSQSAPAPSMMDFDLSGNIPNIEATTNIKPAAPAMNFDDLVFDIPTSEPKPAQEAPKAAADMGMDFSIDFPTSGITETPSSKPEVAQKIDIDFGSININLDDNLPPVHEGGEGKDEQWHEVATKLDLAKAYQEMGDVDGAREILEEVVRDGDATQRESAEKLLQQINA